jgi:hypothetical protein
MATGGWASEEIGSGTDCFIYFAHAAWFGHVVVVYVDGSVCGPIRVAFDLDSGKHLRFEDFEARFAQEVARNYKVTNEELREYDGDVLNWATYPNDGRSHRAMREFRKSFPRRWF